MSLTDPELERYARHIVLREVGGAGQLKLKAARVAVIGAGGIGCPVLTSLAAAGVGALTVIDDDIVAVSNLQRQTLFTGADVGRGKAEVACAALARVNPHVVVTPVAARIAPGNAAALLAGHDLVIDGSDTFATRLAVGDAAVGLGVPLVSGAVAMFQGQIGTFAGHLPNQPCYRCFVGDAFDSDDCDTCAEDGMLGAASALVGHWTALEAIRAIVGFGEDARGRLRILDALTPTLRTIRITKDAACTACGVPKP